MSAELIAQARGFEALACDINDGSKLSSRDAKVMLTHALSYLRDVLTQLEAAEDDAAAGRLTDEVLASYRDEVREEARRIVGAIVPGPGLVLPPVACDSMLCGLASPDDLDRVCTAADGHPERYHATHGAQGRVVAWWPVTVPFGLVTRPAFFPPVPAPGRCRCTPDECKSGCWACAPFGECALAAEVVTDVPLVHWLDKDGDGDPEANACGAPDPAWTGGGDRLVASDKPAEVTCPACLSIVRGFARPVASSSHEQDVAPMCWHRDGHDCGMDFPPPGTPGAQCGADSGDGGLTCTAAAGHWPAGHVGHGLDGVVIGHWRSESPPAWFTDAAAAVDPLAIPANRIGGK